MALHHAVFLLLLASLLQHWPCLSLASSRRPPRRPPRRRGAAARRQAPPAPAFRLGLERPEVVRLEELEDVMLVTKSSSFDDAARWIRDGGRAMVVDHWRDFEICRKTLLKPLRQAAATAKDAERQRTLKKELSDRLLGPVASPGRIALEGAPPADFLQSLYGDLLAKQPRDQDSPAFALPSGVLLGLVNAWQYFQGGVRFPFLPRLEPIRPFYGVYAYPHPVTHFELLIEWLKNSTSPPRTALDLGTGCGVVSLILRSFSQVPRITASDVSVNAVYGAREELRRQGMAEVEVIQSDLFDGLGGQRYDLVVFNPPWLPLPAPKPGEPPRSKLDSGNFYPEDLFLRIFDALPQVLNPGGSALLLFSNHAMTRGYVEEHPLTAAVAKCQHQLRSQVVTRDFNLEGRRRRTGRPQVSTDDEPMAELWEFQLEP